MLYYYSVSSFKRSTFGECNYSIQFIWELDFILVPFAQHRFARWPQSFIMPPPHALRVLLSASNDRHNKVSGPPSPTFSDTTQASAMNFGESGPAKIITRAHLKASMQAYEDVGLLAACIHCEYGN